MFDNRNILYSFDETDMKSINPNKYKFWYGSKETSKKKEQMIFRKNFT